MVIYTDFNTYTAVECQVYLNETLYIWGISNILFVELTKNIYIDDMKKDF